MKATNELDRRSFVGLGLGLALGAGAWWAEARSSSARRVAVWLADRDAQQVIGLDRDLLHCVRFPVSHPIALAPAREGGVWVVSVLRGGRGGRRSNEYEWLLLDAEGGLVARGECSGFAGLRAEPRGGCRILRAGGAVLERRAADGGLASRQRVGLERSRELAQREVDRPGGVGLAVGAPDRALVWSAGGELEVLEGDQREGCACLREEVLDACAASSGWWVLTRRALLELGEGLAVRRELPVSKDASRLGAAAVGTGVWTLDAIGLQAELVGCSVRGRRRREWRLAGVDSLTELEGETLLLTAPGALLVLDRFGEPRAGQGGFARLAGLALAEFERVAGRARST